MEIGTRTQKNMLVRFTIWMTVVGFPGFEPEACKSHRLSTFVDELNDTEFFPKTNFGEEPFLNKPQIDYTLIL